MNNRFLMIIVGILSILGALFSTDKISYSEDCFVANNYMDIKFIDVSSRNGSNVFISADGSGIELKNVDLSQNREVITYRIKNNSSTYDVDMKVLVNGNSFYYNDYFSISCSELGKVKQGDVIEGYITIELKKDGNEAFSIPFNIEIEASPIKKEYLF